MKAQLINLFKIIILVSILGFSVNFLYAGWTLPLVGTTPPDNNRPAPINVSTISQTKKGPLAVDVFLVDGIAYFYGDFTNNLGGNQKAELAELGVIGTFNVDGKLLSDQLEVFGDFLNFSTAQDYTFVDTGDVDVAGDVVISSFTGSGNIDLCAKPDGELYLCEDVDRLIISAGGFATGEIPCTNYQLILSSDASQDTTWTIIPGQGTFPGATTNATTSSGQTITYTAPKEFEAGFGGTVKTYWVTAVSAGKTTPIPIQVYHDKDSYTPYNIPSDGFEVPNCVQRITVQVWGAGGDGGKDPLGGGGYSGCGNKDVGGINFATGGGGSGGGGGGGVAYNTTPFSVNPGDKYQVIVSNHSGLLESSFEGGPYKLIAKDGEDGDLGGQATGIGAGYSAGPGGKAGIGDSGVGNIGKSGTEGELVIDGGTGGTGGGGGDAVVAGSVLDFVDSYDTYGGGGDGGRGADCDPATNKSVPGTDTPAFIGEDGKVIVWW